MFKLRASDVIDGPSRRGELKIIRNLTSAQRKTILDNIDKIVPINLTRLSISEAEMNGTLEYLKAIGLLKEIPDMYDNTVKQAITMPGIVYSYAKIISDNLNSSIFTDLDLSEDFSKVMVERELELIRSHLLTQIKGRLLEQVILFDTIKTRGSLVGTYSTSLMEYDMIIAKSGEESAFEIKHSDKQDKYQILWLQCIKLANSFYKDSVFNRYVIYIYI